MKKNLFIILFCICFYTSCNRYDDMTLLNDDPMDCPNEYTKLQYEREKSRRIADCFVLSFANAKEDSLYYINNLEEWEGLVTRYWAESHCGNAEDAYNIVDFNKSSIIGYFTTGRCRVNFRSSLCKSPAGSVQYKIGVRERGVCDELATYFFWHVIPKTPRYLIDVKRISL